MKVVTSLVLVMAAGAAAPVVAQPASTPAAAPVIPAPVQPSIGASTGVVISMDQAVAIALKRQPSLKATRANIEAARARVDLAKVVRHPTVSAAATVGVSSGRGGGLCVPDEEGNTSDCSSSGFFSPSLSTGLSASAAWRLYDFGQTRANIRAAELSADATAAGLGTDLLDVRTNVEVNYLEAVARQRLIGVAQTTVDNELQHVDQAQKFVAAGARDPIELTQAQSRAANAQSSLAQAQSAQAISLANLRASIGWLDPNRSPTVANDWPQPPDQDPGDLPVLVAAARKQRPEVFAADKQIEAAQASVTASSYGRRPVISASASTQWDPGLDDFPQEPSWAAGLTLSWNFIDGGRTAANKRSAEASVLVSEANKEALLVQLTSQLELARAQIVANRANQVASTEAVRAARAQLQLADARYAQGLGSQIEIADAQTAVTTAEGNLVTAEWQLATAWANLRRALGVIADPGTQPRTTR